MVLEKQLQRWTEARLIDSATADRILRFEEESGKKGLRWPAILAVAFGTLMLCAGVLLYVASHWDALSPSQRFILVLTLVAVFHVAASLLGSKVPTLGFALHVAGTAALGAGIFLSAQIFNLEEHWPGGIMLWAIGAVLAWVILRQWPQALLAALLIPAWLGSEWYVATERYTGAWHVAAQGFLLLSILYFSTTQKDSNRALRIGLLWVGCFTLIPFLGDVMFTGESHSWRFAPRSLPTHLAVIGYAAAYLPVLVVAAYARKRQAVWMFGAAAWVLVVGLLSQVRMVGHNPWISLWVAIGACPS